MHIVVDSICLDSLNFKLNIEHAENRNYNLHITCQSDFDNDENPSFLIQSIRFDVTHKVDNSPFELSFVIVAQYRSEGEGTPTLKEFADSNGPAYVVPYARELIANITSRAGVIPTLILPPINIFNLIDGSKDPDSEPTLGLDQDPSLTEDQQE